MKDIYHLPDFYTLEQFPISSKLTNGGDSIAHDHTFFEIFYITSGSVFHSRDGGKTVTLSGGDLYIIPLGHYHIFMHDDFTTCEHRDIMINPGFFKNVSEFISPTFYSSLMDHKMPWHTTISALQIKELENKLNLINSMKPLHQSSSYSLSKIVLTELLSYFYSQITSVQEEQYPSWFSDLLMRFNSSELLSQGLNEIIKPFYFSKEHICRTFKQYMKMTMTDYLNERRLSEAAHLLLTTNDSVAEICKKVGFTSDSYFNSIFKKKYHLSPLKFRNNHLD